MQVTVDKRFNRLRSEQRIASAVYAAMSFGKGQRDCVVEEAGLFAPCASEGFYSEEKRQDETLRHTRDAMQGNTSFTFASARTRCANHRRSEFLWVQAGTLYGRRGRTMLHFSGKKGECGMGAGGRHPRLFRQNLPRLDDRQRTDETHLQNEAIRSLSVLLVGDVNHPNHSTFVRLFHVTATEPTTETLCRPEGGKEIALSSSHLSRRRCCTAQPSTGTFPDMEGRF